MNSNTSDRNSSGSLMSDASDVASPVRTTTADTQSASKHLDQSERHQSVGLLASEEQANQTIGGKIDRLQDSDDTNNPHAFVVMPFGKKEGSDEQIVDFDAVYKDLIKPALEAAGFEPFRADEETISGDILTDMFQELLLADLVIADMSIDNANVFYELGVRHAFRKRGVVHIQCGRSYMPFDVFNVRTMPYHINANGVPDLAHIDRDRQNLIRITRDTWASDTDAVHSPIFNLVTGLIEPDRGTLRTPLATGFWREFNEWEQQVAIARRQKRIGDILLLTEEISNPLCKEDAIAQAGLALRELGRHELALQEYRNGLTVNPKNIEFRREEAVILKRMGRVDEAIIKLENLLVDEPSDTRATVYLGRIYRSIWKDCWARKDGKEARQQAAFEAYQWMIKSIDTYLKGFHFDLNAHEPGGNALNLSSILFVLADRYDDNDDPDADVQRITELLPELRSTIGFALKAAAQNGATDYWTWATLAEWHLTRGDNVITVSRAYRKALSFARKSVFHLRSSLRQLELFRDLGLYEECTEVALEIIGNEIQRIEMDGVALDELEYPPPETEVLAILFTGHALDKEDAKAERFPAELEDEVRRQIDLALDRARADSNEHAFVSGAACGSDIIFIEACLDRGIKVHIHMPYMEAAFISDYVSYGGKSWIERFYAIRNNPRVNLYYQEDKVGRAKEGIDPYERNSRWALYASLVLGMDKLRLIALWDGMSETASDSDGKRVSGMIQQMQQMGGIVDHLNVTKLEYLFKLNSSVQERDPDASLEIEARVELLKKVSLFSSLHSVDLTQIALVAQEREYTDGSVLTREGELSEEMYIIVSGEVSVRRVSEQGIDKEVARRCTGDYVGELAVFHDDARTASLVADGTVTLLVLSQQKFREILRSRPETSLALTRMLANRLIDAANTNVKLNTESLLD